VCGYVPFNEGTQQIHVIGAGELGPQLSSQGRLVVRVGHQRRIRQRGDRPRQPGDTEPVRRPDLVEALDFAGIALPSARR
jgi:hypothetical protein